ncbi:MAG TPA: electron transport complex subunit E [bacterium]|nr:electron transport complex subunit E [bacterium]HPP86655.1 electron transport complex subunit E [bacterium]
MNNLLKEFFKGFIKENPVLVLLLGLCPTLAVTTSAINGLAMGLAATVVLICSNVIISALKKTIPDNVRIPAFIVIIASFVTMIDLVMSAYFPEIHKTLGLFIPLIVVNCIILGRAEAFASKNNIFVSFLDGAGMGLGFALALTCIGAIREIIGNGTLFDISLLSDSFQPALLMVLPPGGFFTLAFLLFLLNLKKK